MTVKYLLFLLLITFGNGLKLVQVLVLSRHGLRTPIFDNFANISPHKFPVREEPVGYLTKKGALLESYIASYFGEWLNTTGMFQGCPEEDSVFVYANTLQRTRETAKVFAENAFYGCNVPVYSVDSNELDPVFNIILRNTSEELKDAIINEMQYNLNKLDLHDAYLEMDRILDINSSKYCENYSICSLADWNNTVDYKIGQEPNVEGPLAVGYVVADTFLMDFYEGVPLEIIGWGKINRPELWKIITEFTRANQKIRFNSPLLAQEIAKPLLSYMTNVLKKDKPTLTVLVGHDANLISVMNCIGVKPFVLPDQHEITPIGGKLVFQKWLDDENDRYLFKLDYLYQTTDQLVLGEKLSSDNPPNWMSLVLKNCDDDNGFCPWDKFMHILELTTEPISVKQTSL